MKRFVEQVTSEGTSSKYERHVCFEESYVVLVYIPIELLDVYFICMRYSLYVFHFLFYVTFKNLFSPSPL